VFDNACGEFRWGLHIFGQCPQPRKRECRVPGCGAQPFLQQFERYHFKPTLFSGVPKVILFDHAAGFLVSPPKIDAKLREVKWRGSQAGDDGTISCSEQSTARAVQRDVGIG
jgi:hypothetical protein